MTDLQCFFYLRSQSCDVQASTGTWTQHTPVDCIYELSLEARWKQRPKHSGCKKWFSKKQKHHVTYSILALLPHGDETVAAAPWQHTATTTWSSQFPSSERISQWASDWFSSRLNQQPELSGKKGATAGSTEWKLNVNILKPLVIKWLSFYSWILYRYSETVSNPESSSRMRTAFFFPVLPAAVFKFSWFMWVNDHFSYLLACIKYTNI